MKKFREVLIVLLGCLLLATTVSAGPYASSGYTLSNATYAGWATSIVDYDGFLPATAPSHLLPVSNILGEQDSDVARGTVEGGYVVLGFDTTITDGAGDDFAVWENGFVVTGTDGLVYAELGYVSVSSDGDNWTTFDSVSLTDSSSYISGDPENIVVDPSDTYNLAGNFRVGQGTGFDLSDLADNEAVLAGFVDLSEINYIMLTDVVSGTGTDSLGNVIYDGISYGGGADWDAVGVLNAVPVPAAVWLLGSGLLGLIGIRRNTKA